MPDLEPAFVLAFAASLAALLLPGVLGGRARSGADFALAGRRAGSWSVAGAIMGTLVGGAATIGTAQLAFLFGLSAWWFTLGAGLACLLLALFLAGPLRDAEVTTVAEFVARRHGPRARLAASLFSGLGMFIHIVAQLLAAGALLTALFGLSPLPAAAAATALVVALTLGGGMRSAGRLGLLKLVFLYLVMALAGVLAWRQAGGWQGLRTGFPAGPWFDLFGYGAGRGINDLLAMLVGVVSTQTYLQALFSARDRRAARQGALLSAVLIPPLGLFGIAVGLAMRLHRPGLESVQALPAFLRWQLPPAVAGLAFATLLVAALATASGLALGVGTTLEADLLGRDGGRDLGRLRRATLAVVLAAGLLVAANLGSAILSWSFLSMGLRGATLCLPVLAAVLLRERSPRRAGALAIFIGPSLVIAAGLLGPRALPPLYPGLAAALLLFAGGLVLERRRPGRG